MFTLQMVCKTYAEAHAIQRVQGAAATQEKGDLEGRAPEQKVEGLGGRQPSKERGVFCTAVGPLSERHTQG